MTTSEFPANPVVLSDDPRDRTVKGRSDRPKIRVAIASDIDPEGVFGRALLGIEDEHVQIYRRWFKELKQSVRNVPGRYNSRRCAEIARDGAMWLASFVAWNNALENYALDYYGHHPGDQRYADAMASAAAYRDLASAMLDLKETEWRNNKCAKIE